MNETSLYVRIALMCLVALMFQITVVAQFTVFGVNADLSPLIVAAVGLLCGSICGAGRRAGSA